MCDPDSIKPEPIPGLPEELPEGERLLWQGSPDWKALALHVFHVRAVAIYFAVLLVWKSTEAVVSGAGAGEAVAAATLVALFGSAALGLLVLFARLIARSTIYSITSARVVIRAGVALPKAINIPFSKIGSAALALRKSGNGDIPLELTGPDRIAYLHLWPHARPWRLGRAQPMLRGLPDAAVVAERLAGALADRAGQPRQAVAQPTGAGPEPQRRPARAALAHGQA